MTRKANREINIISLSLLDILCGALGAFCFLLLALLPYWRPEKPDELMSKKPYEEAVRELEDLREMAKKASNAEDLRPKLDRLQKRLNEQQNVITQKDRVISERERMIEEKDKRLNQLEAMNGVTVTMEWYTQGHDMDIYLRTSLKKKGEPMPAPDTGQKQGVFFGGDFRGECKQGPCHESWVMRDSIAGEEMEVYYKFMDAGGNAKPAEVGGYFVHDGQFHMLPAVSIAAPKTSVLVGKIIVGANRKPAFVPAPEYAEAYKKRLEAQNPPTGEVPQPGPLTGAQK